MLCSSSSFAAAMTVRSRPLPPHLDNPPFAVRRVPVSIHHPGYGDPSHLIVLDALEPVPGIPDVYGIHHQTALDACRIIASNQDGFLSRTQDRSARVPADDVLLCEKDYWYHLLDESCPDPYPIVDRFAAWRFPAAVPAHWAAAHTRVCSAERCGSESAMSERVKTMDGKCILTGYRESYAQALVVISCFNASTVGIVNAFDNARLIPKQYSLWYDAYGMYTYNHCDSHGCNDIVNGVALRADIHQLLDSDALVFVPIEGQFVAHFLAHYVDYGQLYHNVPISLPE